MKKPFIKPTESQIESWIKTNILDYKTRSSSSRGVIYLIDNPAIPGDSGYHLGISPSEGWCRDFRPPYSDWNVSFLKFVSKIRNCSFHDAIKEVCGNKATLKALIAEVKRAEAEIEEEPEEVFALPDNVKTLGGGEGAAWKIATNYLRRRQISVDEAVKLDIRYNVTSLCFPYYEYGMIVYYQTRDMMAKRFYFPTVDAAGEKSNAFLYGFDNVEPMTPAIVTEAIFDSIMIGEGGLATGGATFKRKQISKLRALNPSMVVLAPDSDNAGLISLRSNYDLLEPHFGGRLYHCLPPKEHKDWNAFAQAVGRIKNPTVVRDWIDDRIQPLDSFSVLKLTDKAIEEVEQGMQRRRKLGKYLRD